MATTFLATAAADTFTNPSHSVRISATQGNFGPSIFNNSTAVPSGVSDATEPYNGFVEGPVSDDTAGPEDTMLDIIAFVDGLGTTRKTFYFEVFDGDTVDYSAADHLFVDLELPVQQNDGGGLVAGDVLTNISGIIGSPGNDIIRGSNTSGFPPDSTIIIVNGQAIEPSPYFFTLRNPGQNTLSGGAGDDLLEGRGGADTLNGGSGFDFASYDSSASGVTVRLPGVGGDPQIGQANGGDATGDQLISIEGLVGSAFADHLTGNSLNNVLAGGLGSDVLDGKDGTDTADYSRNHFFSFNGTFHTADQVGVNLANGTATEFVTGTNTAVSIDTLISIENVIGTAGNDAIIGNDQGNRLEGRNGNDVIDGGRGNDTLDGGFGNDTLVGGDNTDTASYVSHDFGAFGEIGTISLGLNGADGSATYGSFFSVIQGRSVFLTVETDTLLSLENVTGSNLAETINGNELDNVLDGRGGNDTINGNAGRDTLSGGDGHNTVNGGSDNDTYVYTRGAVDRYFDDSGTDSITTDSNLSLGDRLVAVRSGNDLVVTLTLSNTTGSFTVVDHFAGHPIESLVLGGISVTLAVGTIGGNAPGIIAAGNGGETLDGRGGDDFLFGGNGSDRLIGGDGDDRLTGGNGGDTFVFGPGFGHDIVTDFGHADRIEFDGGLFGNFRVVQSAIQQVGDDTLITLDESNSITLQGVAADSLHASHFLFV